MPLQSQLSLGTPSPATTCCGSVPLGEDFSPVGLSELTQQREPPCQLPQDTRGQQERNVLPDFPRCCPGQPGSINTTAYGITARRSQPAPVPMTAGISLPARAPTPAPRHPDTRSWPQPLPAFRNICHSHGRLKIKAEKRESKGSLGVGATTRISGTMHAKAPSTAIRAGAVSERWGTQAGLCLPRTGGICRPPVGRCQPLGSGRSTAKQTAPGRCHLPELPGPEVLSVLPRAGGGEKKGRRGESRVGRGKQGRRKMGRKGLDGCGGELGEVRGPSARQPPSTELHGGEGSEPGSASSTGDQRDLPAPCPRCPCCGLGQAAPGGRCRGLEAILRP